MEDTQPQERKQLITQEDYLLVNSLVNLSKSLPTKNSCKLYQNFEQLSAAVEEIRKKIMVFSKFMVKYQSQGFNIKIDDMEGFIVCNQKNFNYIKDVISKSKNGQFPDELKNITQRPQSAVRSSIGSFEQYEIKAKTFLMYKFPPRQTKPQDSFTVKPDNSYETLWRPIITDKPNAKRPLQLTELKDSQQVYGYENVYLYENQTFMPEKQVLERDSRPYFIAPFNSDVFTYIDTYQDLVTFSNHLNSVSEFAVDVEHHSRRSYMGLTCLVQITTETGGNFILDTLALRDHMHILNQSFTDPKIIKVLHGASNDVLWLQRDLGLYIVGMFDTFQAALKLGYSKKSLEYLIRRHCCVQIDKSFCCEDWRIRPLPRDLLIYAQSDTHYLLFIYHKMKMEILSLLGTAGLVEVYKQSAQIAGKPYIKPIYDDKNAMNQVSLWHNPKKEAVFKSLYFWRDKCARMYDEHPDFVMKTGLIHRLARYLPKGIKAVTEICSPCMSYIVANKLAEINAIISLANEKNMGNMKPPYIIVSCQKRLEEGPCHDENFQLQVEESIYEFLYYPLMQKPNMILLSMCFSELQDVLKNKYLGLYATPHQRYIKYFELLQLEKAPIKMDVEGDEPPRVPLESDEMKDPIEFRASSAMPDTGNETAQVSANTAGEGSRANTIMKFPKSKRF